MTKKSSFLSLVANDLLQRFGNDLSPLTIIFPGRRARLFFNNYLYQISNTPVWAPRYLTIEELFHQQSILSPGDDIRLICQLYEVYKNVFTAETGKPFTETLDEFFFFGEILLKDFNDVDKNLVNARSLFSNLQDLDQLKDDFTHLNESQLEALLRYFRQTFYGETPLKNAFWSIWNILGKIYISFQEKLKGLGVGYEGMIMRSVIEDENITFPGKQYVFIGFNVLSKCEEALFRKLKDRSLFYWDVDSYYLKEKEHGVNEAGKFIKENIRKFGSALDPALSDNHFSSPDKKFTIISSPSESGQAAYISKWIDQLNVPKEFTAPDSAIVLCNEAILPVVMHSIPFGKVENINITMGFPITQAPICSFLHVLTEMQTKGYSETSGAFRYKYVLPVLRHPYTKMILPDSKEIEDTLIRGNIFFPTLEILKNPVLFSYKITTSDLALYLLTLVTEIGKSYENKGEETYDVYAGFYRESVFRAYQVINRLYGLLISNELSINKTTFLRLLKKIFSSTRIPFHGEPVRGLQIMGMLETRALDFKNLLLLSVNEEFIPGSTNDDSFIPQFLRKYLELSTVEHQDSVYAYYFYRLLQRAEHITLIYNTDKSRSGKAEMSRFLLQLMTDSSLTIEKRNLSATIKPLQTGSIQIQKDKPVLEKIKDLYDIHFNPRARSLSPSALNVFIDCSFKFYLQYIEGIKPPTELSDELDSSVFGTIFHRAAELLYREIGRIKDSSQFKPFLVKKELLEPYTKNHRLDKLLLKAFSEIYFKGRIVDPNRFNGEQLINFRVIRHMLKRLVEFDRKKAPFFVYGLEYSVYTVFKSDTEQAAIRVGGIIDRLEEKDGIIYIVDYKTSGVPKKYNSMEELVIQKDLRASHIFQIFTYASVLFKNGNLKKPISPSLLYLQEAGKDDYSSVISYNKEPILDFELLYEDFISIFRSKISEIFNPRFPFSQTSATSNCTYCDFKNLCNR